MEEKTVKKLFYEDSFQRSFEAVVISCERKGDQYQVVLDQTAFFPEGGGQYADTGRLGGVRVLDVREKDGVIWHVTEEPLVPGETVRGELDWDVRFERMQQHTGEHIVSGIVHGRFGYDNVGFHLADDYCTMDFNGPISRDELREIEWEANRAVAADLDVLVEYPDRETLAELDYRSKIEIEGQVRIVTIPGYDVCACCAPHVRRTGQIGVIKLVSMVNYKGGERITMLCGFRALRDYARKQENARQIGAMLCEKENEIAGAVERLKRELEMKKQECIRLEQRICRYRAQETEILPGVTCVFEEEMEGNAPRDLMNALLERGAKICAVFAGNDREGYRYVIGSRTEDVRPLGRALNEKFCGRGGGKPEMVQGSLSGCREEILRELQGR